MNRILIQQKQDRVQGLKVVVVAARHDCTGSRSSKFKGSMFKGLKLFMGLNGCAVYKFKGLTFKGVGHINFW